MADSTQIKAIDAIGDLDAADRALAAIERAGLAALLSERVRGGLELPDGEAERLVAALATRIEGDRRTLLKALVWSVHNRARNYNAPPDAHDTPTRPVRVTAEFQAAVAEATKP